MPGQFNPFRWNRLPLNSAGLSAARVMLRRVEQLDLDGSLALFFRVDAGGSLGLFFHRAVNRAK